MQSSAVIVRSSSHAFIPVILAAAAAFSTIFSLPAVDGQPTRSPSSDEFAPGGCSQWPPPCSQVCDNATTNPADRCACVAGYSLDVDQYRCLPEPWALGSDPLLLYTTDKTIVKLVNMTGPLRRAIPITLHDADNEITALDVNIDEQRVYFAEAEDRQRAVIKHFKVVKSTDEDGQSQLRAEDVTPLIVNGITVVKSLAVDWIGQNVLLACEHSIVACSTATQHCTTISANQTDDFQPESLAVDALNGRLYWSNCGGEGRIMVSNLDGSDLKVLNNTAGLGCSVSLHIDLPRRDLYFVSKARDAIEIYNIDSRTNQPIKTFPTTDDVRGVESVVTVLDDLLWSIAEPAGDDSRNYGDDDYESSESSNSRSRDSFGAVVKAPKFSNFDPPSEVAKYIVNVPRILRVMQGGLQMSVAANPCDRLACSHICLPKSHNSATCSCPAGFQLMGDGQQCSVDWSVPGILVASDNELLYTAISYIGGNASHVLHTADADISALAYDASLRTVYVAVNTTTGSVVRYRLGNNAIDVLYSGAADVLNMAVDVTSNNIYWVSGQQKNRVTILRSDGAVATELMLTDALDSSYTAVTICNPADDPDLKLYYASCGSQPHIGKCKLDGSECTLVLTLTNCVRDLHCDTVARKIYMTDSVMGSISVFSTVDATAYAEVDKYVPNPHSVTTSMESFLLADSGNPGDIMNVNKLEPSEMARIRTGRQRLGAIIAIDNRIQSPTATGSCSGGSNGGCDGLCLPSSAENHVCQCSSSSDPQPCRRPQLPDSQAFVPVGGQTTASSIRRRSTAATFQSPSGGLPGCDNFCRNAGSCYIDDGGTTVCSCSAGYTGSRCESKADEQTRTAATEQPSMFSSVHVWVAAVICALAVLVAVIVAVMCTVKRRRRAASQNDDEVHIKNATDQADVKLAPMMESSFTNACSTPFTIPRPKLVDNPGFVNSY